MLSFILRSFGYLGAWVGILTLAFFGYALLNEYTPDEIENLHVTKTSSQSPYISSNTIRVLSWNIGYAGLGDDMDFFMDGGESSRTSRGRTLENLRGVVDFIDSQAESLDFILLQEVDKCSKRSYEINEYDTLLKHFGMKFTMNFAPNFKVFYVPIPLFDAIGKVESGLVTLSRYTPLSAQRVSLPKDTDFPDNIFNLKRCMLTLEVQTNQGDTLHITNSHNSAYDEGGLRKREMEFISNYLSKQNSFIIAGDWNSNPVGYTQSPQERMDKNFVPAILTPDSFNSEYHYGVDLSSHTARYGYEPYKRGSTTTSLIDFSLSSKNITPIKVECIDLGFKNSDHNPVIYTYHIK